MKKYKKGFTLIELIVIIGIFAIATIGTFMFFNKNVSKSVVEEETSNLSSLFESIEQAHASNGKYDPSIISLTALKEKGIQPKINNQLTLTEIKAVSDKRLEAKYEKVDISTCANFVSNFLTIGKIHGAKINNQEVAYNASPKEITEKCMLGPNGLSEVVMVRNTDYLGVELNLNTVNVDNTPEVVSNCYGSNQHSSCPTRPPGVQINPLNLNINLTRPTFDINGLNGINNVAFTPKGTLTLSPTGTTPTTPTTPTTTCQADQNLVNGLCYPKCIAPATYDAATQQCVTPPNTNCPAGQIKINDKCVPDDGTNCKTYPIWYNETWSNQTAPTSSGGTFKVSNVSYTPETTLPYCYTDQEGGGWCRNYTDRPAVISYTIALQSWIENGNTFLYAISSPHSDDEIRHTMCKPGTKNEMDGYYQTYSTKPGSIGLWGHGVMYMPGSSNPIQYRYGERTYGEYHWLLCGLGFRHIMNNNISDLNTIYNQTNGANGTYWNINTVLPTFNPGTYTYTNSGLMTMNCSISKKYFDYSIYGAGGA